MVHHPDMEKHIQELEFVECSDRYRVIIDQLMKQWRSWCWILAPMATDEQILRAHGKKYLNRLSKNIGSVTKNNLDLPCNEWTYRASKLAAGAAITLVQNCLMQGGCGFAVVRPPGHHAEYDRPEGFCYLNNVMIAALDALATGSAERILIVDWDVHYHHGSADILSRQCHLTADQLQIFSMHRYDNGNFYPGTPKGATGTYYNGRITNYGFNTVGNDQNYVEALKEFIDQYLKGGRPDIIIVSCGFDAAEGDPIGGFEVTPQGYYEMTRVLLGACSQVALVLEGGYNLDILPSCANACMQALGEK